MKKSNKYSNGLKIIDYVSGQIKMASLLGAKVYVSKYNISYISCPKIRYIDGMEVSELGFDKDWNMLMMVYKKLIKKRVPLYSEQIIDGFTECNIKKAYKYILMSI